jgi:hypothetical protein
MLQPAIGRACRCIFRRPVLRLLLLLVVVSLLPLLNLLL